MVERDPQLSAYDEDWNEEDDFWIYDVYLTSDGGGGGGGNEGDDDGGDWGDCDVEGADENWNGYVGDTEGDEAFHQHFYFDI